VSERFVGALSTLLDSKKSEELYFQVLCVITEIAGDNAKVVVDCGIIPQLKKFLQSEDGVIAVQAASALGNLAYPDGSGPVLASDLSLFPVILEKMDKTLLCEDGRVPSHSLIPFRTYTFLLDALLFHGSKGSIEQSVPFLNYFRILMQHHDKKLREYCVSCVGSLSLCSNTSDRKLIVSAKIVPELMILVLSDSSPDLSLISLSIRIMGNIAIEEEEEVIHYLLSVGVLSYLSKIFHLAQSSPGLFPSSEEKEELFRGSFCLLGNILLNGSEAHLREVI
jgi:hypothetical protein